MNQLIKNVITVEGIKTDVLVSDNIISEISFGIDENKAEVVFDFNNKYIFPGFTDVHVHLREPGFFYKETIKTGTKAAAHGGFTDVCSMPNLNPVPSNYETLKKQLDIIEKDAVINVHPFGSITVDQNGEKLAEMDEMAEYVIGFSDDGRGVQSEGMMKSAMEKAKALGKVISAHCEVNELLEGGYIHKGDYAKKHNHKGICSESEWKQIERDILLVKETGVKYHVCHISTKESVELIRQAKKEGVDITCETAPHYLVFNDSMLKDEGRYKMNPPIRSEEDRQALIAGVCDGTIDMIATDHAPHSAEEKAKGLEKSLNGIVGIETSFAVCYTHLVKTGKITLKRLIELYSDNPCKRFLLDNSLKVGNRANFTIFDLDNEYEINSADFLSMGKSTPFEGMKVFGSCEMTMAGGKIAWSK